MRPSQEVLQKISTWTNISTVAAGVDHILGLKKDGTVVAVGDNSEHQCEVEAWNDVVAIAAGRAHSIGLRFDGKVYGAGADNVHQRNVANWKDIVEEFASLRQCKEWLHNPWVTVEPMELEAAS